MNPSSAVSNHSYPTHDHTTESTATDLNFLKKANIDLNESQVQACIKHVATQLFQIEPDQVHALPKTIRTEVIKSVIDNTLPGAVDIQKLKSYLDSDIVGELLITQKSSYDGIIDSYCESTHSIALHGTMSDTAIHEMLQKISPHTKACITTLDLSRCSFLADLSLLKDFPNITELNLTRAVSLKSLQGIENVPNLKKLTINECRVLRNLDGLNGNKTLTTLLANQCSYLSNIGSIDTCTSLQELDLSDCYQLKVFEPIGHLENLEKLSLRRLLNLKDIGVCENLPKLNELHLEHSGVTNISPLDRLEKLPKESVYLTGCKLIKAGSKV